jgi:hypothetical protein
MNLVLLGGAALPVGWMGGGFVYFLFHQVEGVELVLSKHWMPMEMLSSRNRGWLLIRKVIDNLFKVLRETLTI